MLDLNKELVVLSVNDIELFEDYNNEFGYGNGCIYLDDSIVVKKEEEENYKLLLLKYNS